MRGPGPPTDEWSALIPPSTGKVRRFTNPNGAVGDVGHLVWKTRRSCVAIPAEAADAVRCRWPPLTFSEPMDPAMGMFTSSSAMRSTGSVIPSSSEPITTTSGPFRSASSSALAPFSVQATMRGPWSLAPSEPIRQGALPGKPVSAARLLRNFSRHPDPSGPCPFSGRAKRVHRSTRCCARWHPCCARRSRCPARRSTVFRPLVGHGDDLVQVLFFHLAQMKAITPWCSVFVRRSSFSTGTGCQGMPRSMASWRISLIPSPPASRRISNFSTFFPARKASITGHTPHTRSLDAMRAKVGLGRAVVTLSLSEGAYWCRGNKMSIRPPGSDAA